MVHAYLYVMLVQLNVKGDLDCKSAVEFPMRVPQVMLNGTFYIF